MKKELITARDIKSPISEMFKILRTNIQFMNTKNNNKFLLVTSVSPQEGKSCISANLAVTFAQTGKRVIVIDSDMRKGRQNVIFSTTNDKGLSEFLSSKKSCDIAEYIKETEIPNLYLMTSGKIPKNPSELLVSNNMLRLMEELENVFDLIIFDGAPTSLVPDSMILARLVDSVVIVAQYNKTKKEQIVKLKKNIENVGGKILGVVMNRQKISLKKYNKKYYYTEETRLVKARR